VDRLRRVLERPVDEVPHRGARERPEDQVAEVARRRGEARPPVHGDADGGGLERVAEPARARHGAPHVCQDRLEPAEGAATPFGRLGADPRDEVLGEVCLVDHDVVLLGVVAVAVAMGRRRRVGRRRGPAVLHAAVRELDERRVARWEEAPVVDRRRRADGEPARGAAPGDEEVAGGVAVRHGVVGGEPDGE